MVLSQSLGYLWSRLAKSFADKAKLKPHGYFFAEKRALRVVEPF